MNILIHVATNYFRNPLIAQFYRKINQDDA